MNLINKQARDFFDEHITGAPGIHKPAITALRSELYEYRKTAHQVIFIEQLILLTKIEYDAHYEKCRDKENCAYNTFYENVLFFMQNELDELTENIPEEDFSPAERQETNQQLQMIIDDLRKVRLGQQLTHEDLMKEFQELHQLYFLNKKNWLQLFAGKLTEMVAGGIVSETISKDIISLVRNHLPK